MQKTKESMTNEKAKAADVRRDEADATAEGVQEVQEAEVPVQVEKVIPQVNMRCAYRINSEVYPALICKVHRPAGKAITVDSGVDLMYFDSSSSRTPGIQKVAQGLGNRQWWVNAEALITAVALANTGRSNQS